MPQQQPFGKRGEFVSGTPVFLALCAFSP